MQGLMRDFPLNLPHLFLRAEGLLAKKRIVTAHEGSGTKIDVGEQARIEISSVNVVVPRMWSRVIDRAMLMHGAMGRSPETPLERMYRGIRSGRIVDGLDEVHISRTAWRILDVYTAGDAWDFGLR